MLMVRGFVLEFRIISCFSAVYLLEVKVDASCSFFLYSCSKKYSWIYWFASVFLTDFSNSTLGPFHCPSTFVIS